MKKYFCNINDRFIWFPVPKVATQSFEKAFIKSGGILNSSLTQQLPENHADLFSFIIVRNPWDRLVSAYRDKIVKQWTNNRDKYRIQFYKKYKNIEFKDFVLSLDSETICMENHIKPVVQLAPIDSIKYIGRLETIWKDCDYIFSEIGLKLTEIKATNCTTPWSPGSSYCKYNEYYDDTTKSKVAELYRDDIDTLKYTFD